MEIKCKICKSEKEVKFLELDNMYVAICTKCINLLKSEKYVTIDEYNNYLKNKIKIYNKEYKEKHKEKQKEYKKTYLEKHGTNRINNKEYMKKYREEHKEYFKQYFKKYAERKKEERKKIKKINKEKGKELTKIKKRTRCLINKSFVRKGYKKGTKTEQILNCDFDVFYKHLLQTFKDNYGYDWDGIEEVDIDHIIPLATAKSEEDVIKLCHYTNLQLLKRLDNRKKSAKL